MREQHNSKGKFVEKLNELVRDTILGHMEMCNILEQQGMEPTEENLDRHFPYRNVGCNGLICHYCGSISLWIVKRNWRDVFSKINVDVYRCIDCEKESSFYYDSYNGCYKDPDKAEAWMEEQAFAWKEDLEVEK